MAALTKNKFVSSSIYTPRNGILSLPSFFFFVVLLLLSPVVPRAAAQQPPTDDSTYYRNFSPSMAVIIVVLVAALFFMGFFSIYIRHCNESSAGNSVRQALSMRRRAAARGLDASVIETFPTFSYAEVKDQRIGKGALECAVCLNEFEDDETLRLIPKCDHVFHPECIDAWLEAHVTCPVCRANLAPQQGDEPVQTPEVPTQDQQQEDGNGNGNDQPQNEEISVHVVSDQEQRQQDGEGNAVRAKSVKRNLSFNVPNRPPRSFSIKRPKMFSKFRSHSTGHSLVLPGENLDRYTLKLPEDVRKEMMNRALLNRARSMAVHLPRDASSRRGYRTGGGEGSSRGGRSYRRMDRLDGEGRSDRWLFSIAPPFFSRWPSMKSPKVVADNGEASTSTGGKTAVRMPSFKCLEPKGDEPELIPSSSARPPV
ncbi:E3 ubiquitin-protein ligase ATL31 [Ipomoea triloba]|uniref:E3 ubiquitin-protein ligase ATL31 n=1 Tax=Ipomoea triloba TaxID=35885 RepID=UPI00125D7BFF|nr:E3 ubiquitin-protein ligase ATL31 [Ipomoea triloba]